jgi:uracil permease
MSIKNEVFGYLPDERPPVIELIFFALQQIIVMFPATVLVALITGFHVSTTIFASGLATLGFILITGKKIPLYYGSSFSYIAAIASIMSAEAFAGYSLDQKISIAQFGIIMSGLVSVAAGLIIQRSGKETIDKVLPPTVTGSIAIIIGLSLAANAMTNAAAYPAGIAEGQAVTAGSLAWIIAIITLVSTILYSVYLKGKLSQLPILFGLLTGYAAAAIIGAATGIPFISFNTIQSTGILSIPTFTIPTPNVAAIITIMPRIISMSFCTIYSPFHLSGFSGLLLPLKISIIALALQNIATI